MPGPNLAFWRKWHRWIAFPATLFLLWAAATGVLVAFTEFFGADEALREATRDMDTMVPLPRSRPLGCVTATASSGRTRSGLRGEVSGLQGSASIGGD